MTATNSNSSRCRLKKLVQTPRRNDDDDEDDSR